MQLFINETHDEERAFYGLRQAQLQNCCFEGPADGESALKETADLELDGCEFNLRYPLWHSSRAELTNCRLTESCRAALWYDQDVSIVNSWLNGIKALREANNIRLLNCQINSSEFGWFCHNLELKDCQLQSEYPFLQSSSLKITGLRLTAKYSFQYVQEAVIRNSVLNTKDAFWHSRNVTVYDSVLKGEYLGWYSENLHLVRCKIIGTQPLCYAKGLRLEDCTMQDCDLAFENSEVTASVFGHIDSVKNPQSGCIVAGSIGEIIQEWPERACRIITEQVAFSA